MSRPSTSNANSSRSSPSRAIVLRQVHLMRALESRGSELASKVAQLEALRELGEAVGSSLDLDEVLDRIVSNAVRLTEPTADRSWSTTR